MNAIIFKVTDHEKCSFFAEKNVTPNLFVKNIATADNSFWEGYHKFARNFSIAKSKQKKRALTSVDQTMFCTFSLNRKISFKNCIGVFGNMRRFWAWEGWLREA